MKRKKMDELDRFYIFICVCFLAFFLFVGSLWMIDISVSTIMTNIATDSDFTVRSLFFISDPSDLYHAGLVTATIIFWFVLASLIMHRLEEVKKAYGRKRF
jgi:hypothetical protein